MSGDSESVWSVCEVRSEVTVCGQYNNNLLTSHPVPPLESDGQSSA